MGQKMALLKDTADILPLVSSESIGKIKAKLILNIASGTGKVLKSNLSAFTRADLAAKSIERRNDVF